MRHIFLILTLLSVSLATSETKQERIFTRLYDANDNVSPEEAFKTSMLDSLQKLKEAQEVEDIDRLYDYLI